MVTHEMEGGKLKCHRYWPDPTSNPPLSKQNYGSIVVEYVSTEQHSFYAVRKFLVKYGSEVRELTHFYYQAWPDHGVPSTSDELLTFRHVVKSSVTNTDVPIIIHCSAGVGRTGTYIAIDQLVEQCLDMGGTPDVDRCVRDMRMCRNYMVQTEVQYIFIFRAVLDALTELLEGESAKARRIAAAEEAEREHNKYLQEQAELAAAAKREEIAKQQAAVEEAKKVRVLALML
jgi:protein tyrosine phosphatase